MAQAFLLKTDVAMTSNNAGQKHIKNQTIDTDKAKVESFSSALDKHVDKQAVSKHKQANKLDESDEKVVKPADNVETKKDISSEKSGKILPEDLEKNGEAIDGDDDSELAVNAEAQFSVPAEEAEPETETLNNDVLAATINVSQASEDPINVKDHPVPRLVGQAASVVKKTAAEPSHNKGQVAENGKLTADIAILNKVDAVSTEQEADISEQKQQAPSLRSDILNALLKKPNTEGEKFASSVDQKVVANSVLTTSKEGLSEEQKIMALANNVKLKDSLPTGNAFERSASVSSLLSTTPAAAPASTNPAASVGVSGQPTLNLQPALHSEAWSRVLSSRVIWMAREGVQQASLKLNPANMGPVEVKLHMHNEQANISFIAQNAATRDALEQALPRLRESFQENGMELAHADVSQENFSEADEQDNNKTTNNRSRSERDNVDGDIEVNAHDVNVTEQDVALGLSVFA